MEEFLNEIGIVQKGTISDDGCYVIDFADDDAWSKAESTLNKSDQLEQDSDATQVAMESAVIQYYNDEYDITMKADFNTKEFKLVMREV